MIGILFGIFAAIGYIAASFTNAPAGWVGAGGGFILVTILGVLLFPKSVARYLSIILAAAPVAIIIGVFTGALVPAIVVAIGATIALFIVKLLRPRAREVQI